MMHLILVIAVVFVFAASCLLTFALCRAATRRDMLEARWRAWLEGGRVVMEQRFRLRDGSPVVPRWRR